MRSIEEIITRAGKAKIAAGPGLGEFCCHVSQKLHPKRSGRAPTVEDIAAEFRAFFQLATPVMPHLGVLAEQTGFTLIRHTNVADPDACSDFNAETQRWEILVRCDLGLRESISILREVFKILHAECLCRVPWWDDWLAEAAPALKPKERASRFAYAVALPPPILNQRALECGVNIWTLAAQFMIPPGVCFFGLLRSLRLPIPYFQAQLNFRPDAPLQTRLLFGEGGSVGAEVWKKGYKPVYGKERGNWPEMDVLAGAFPQKHRPLEVEGMLYRSIKECSAMLEITDRLASIALPRPVCIVARPNGIAQSQMFVQVLPATHADLLRDITLTPLPLFL